MKISVFVDGSNLFFMEKKLGWFVDLKKLLSYLKGNDEITDAFYYVGKNTPPEAKQQRFLDALPIMGYSLVTKDIKSVIDDKTGAKKYKANLDIEIVLDMFNTIGNYDKAILVSGDGDFERPLEILRIRGKQLLVLATTNFIAKELKNVVGSHYIDLNDIKNQVQKLTNSTCV